MYSIEEDEGFNKYKPKWQRLSENDFITKHYANWKTLLSEEQINRPPPEKIGYVRGRNAPSRDYKPPPHWKRDVVKRVEKTTPSISQRILWINDKYEVEKQRLASIARDMIELEPNRRDQIISDLGYKLMDMTDKRDNQLQKLYILQGEDDW